MTLRGFTILAVLLLFTASDTPAAEARRALAPKVNFSQGAVYSEDTVNFYGTHIYLLEDSMLRRRAEEQLAHPAPADLKVTAERIPNTSIIAVKASSADDTAAATFLSALIDQFLKFKTEQRRRAFAEEIARVNSAIKTAPRDAINELEKTKKQLVVASLVDAGPVFEKLPDK